MQKEKPNYGYTAMKYFAYMGVIGVVGLCVVVVGTFLNPPLGTLMMIVGIPVAFVGLCVVIVPPPTELHTQ